ncbi:MAG: Gfo/Idh/MocA family oxidoreductase [Armatimonadetes bacterium]|nr:Gfo/Idh/MocA family oxidoreductase [Armatimonadota bacterium]
MSRIRIGQIGIGHEHASGIMAALRRLPEIFEVVGVVEEPNPRWSQRGDRAYQGLPWLTEDELFGIPNLAAVAVETNMPQAVAAAQRCAARGLHIHLDKPGGETMEPFRQLVEACRAQGLALQLGYMYRTNPAVSFCRNAVRQGWLGDIFEVHAVMSRWDNNVYRAFLADYRGGAMYNFGSHLIDLVVGLLGRPDNVVAFQRATRDDGLQDNGLAVLEYPRATATVRTSICEVDGMQHRRLIVCGTRGSAEIYPLEYPGRYELDPLHVRLTLRESAGPFAAGTQRVEVGVMPGRYEAQLAELAAVIRGELANPWPYEHELTVQEVLLAAAGYTTWGG